MHGPSGTERVILVILDGLRSDAIPLLPLPHLRRLSEQGAYTLTAQTVRPSITAAALTSLMTGVGPEVHGVRSERLVGRRAVPGLVPLPRVLASAGLPVRAFRTAVHPAAAGLAAQLARRLGIEASFRGRTAVEVLDTALPSLHQRRPGLTVLHWLEADAAGHRWGWGSREYFAAARGLDEAVGRLVEETGILADPTALLVLVADHGGGGAVMTDHNSDHPLDLTIPLILAGG